MSKHIGRDREVGLAKETTRGTVAVPAFWLPFISFDFDEKFETIIDEQAMGLIEDSNDLKVVKKWAEGSLEGHIRDKSFGLVLLAALGTVSSAVKETTAYDHTFSIAQTIIHQSLTVEAKSPVEQLAYANAMINSLEIKAEVGKYIDFTINVLAKLGAAATTSPAITTENKFIAKDVTVKFADDIAGLGAAEAIKAKNVNLTVEKNIESDDVLSSLEPDDFNNKQIAISGSLELNYDAVTYKALALAGTQKAISNKQPTIKD